MRTSAGIFFGLQLSFFWRGEFGGGGQAAPTFANILIMGAVETNVKHINFCFKKINKFAQEFLLLFFFFR
jgi:hypothetical protein